ncbi:MAG TPA: amidohydrolase family protein, partial [Candidatus Limnocylindrales bacterium]|nr:amidohydrolase family protein [Candidatus Limnocylindrales bacterium]
MTATQADLIITGRIATLSGDSGFGWVEALAIGSDRVIAAGRRHDVEPLLGPGTRTWRLPGDQVVVPGITDAHLHLMTMVVAGQQIDLNGADLDGALARIAQRHLEMAAQGDNDSWILGHGWQLDLVGGWPTAADLDRAASGRPIALWTHDHHSRWLSSRALELAQLQDMPRNGLGSLVRRDEHGRATGILHEGGCMLVDAAIPPPTQDQLRAILKHVSADLLALGLTGVHDPGELTGDTDVQRGPVFYTALAEARRLPLRVHSSVRSLQLDRAIELGFRSGQETGRYRMGWLKLFADGSMGSRSAALLAPYDDAATNPSTGGPTGMVVTDAEAAETRHVSGVDELRVLDSALEWRRRRQSLKHVERHPYGGIAQSV